MIMENNWLKPSLPQCLWIIQYQWGTDHTNSCSPLDLGLQFAKASKIRQPMKMFLGKSEWEPSLLKLLEAFTRLPFHLVWLNSLNCLGDISRSKCIFYTDAVYKSIWVFKIIKPVWETRPLPPLINLNKQGSIKPNSTCSHLKCSLLCRIFTIIT